MKENKKFKEGDDTTLKRLSLLGYSLGDCIEECTGDVNCNFVTFSTNHNNKGREGCFMYNEKDTEKRTEAVNTATEVFCNKIQGA